VTLIPIGALGLLPLHAARLVRTADRGWRDRTGGLVFRYAPNARLLARAQAQVRSNADPPLPLVTVPGAGPARAEPSPADASRALQARYGDELVRHPASSHPDDVLAALGEAAIWHVACRIDHDPVEPLAGHPRLPDGRSLLSTALAQRPAPRLALLSASRTAIDTDVDDLDELVSVAAALVHGGVAGVVSSPSLVDARSAELLTLAFFERFVDGAGPARALADAQAWLASATNREIAEVFGPLHAFPQALPESARAAWEHLREFSDPRSWAPFSFCGA
jgi:hypothetical protein